MNRLRIKKYLGWVGLILLIAGNLWAQEDNDEWRATWVITWEHINSGSTVAQNQARVRQIMDNHVAANMNAVLWQARQGGTAYYNSSYEPWGYYAGGSDPGYDPLAYAIEQAHARGLELHAWFNCFSASSTAAGAPAAEHPEWVCRDQDGIAMPSHRALSPGLQDVREYTIAVAMEIVNNYDIDGLHLDYVRWNEYSDLLLTEPPPTTEEELRVLDQIPDVRLLEALRDERSGRYLYDMEHPYSGGVPAGYGSWAEFWRGSVTDFVHALHDSIQAVKPWVRLSPAALGKYNWSGWNGYDVVYQDAALWFNEGYIDQLTPMHYHWTNAVGFTGMLQNNCPNCWSAFIQPGIDAGALYTVGPGSYQFADMGVWGNHPSVVNAVRNISWTDGFQFFSYGSWQDYQYWGTAGESFFRKMTKVRDTGILSSLNPDAPALELTMVDSLHYQITVSPPDTLTVPQWFVVYRDEQTTLDRDTSTIVSRHFGMTPFAIDESFDGTQDHNDRYHYGATMLNRYWNESGLSSVASTEPIPSFAPLVTAFSPAAGDTVPATVIVDLSFSKTMDMASTEAAFTITPDAAVALFDWTTDGHGLRVLFQQDLEFDTEYGITLAHTATDVNGVELDGNGDGTPGDDFSFTFHTLGMDVAGPIIIASHPGANSGAQDFDVEDVVTMVFNEYLDEAAAEDSGVTLWQGNTQIEADVIANRTGDHGVVSLRADDHFDSAEDYQVRLNTGIRDTLGNPLAEETIIPITTFNRHYAEIITIDEFRSSGYWESPGYSGSTHGIVGANTEWGYSNQVYLPASYQYNSRRKSAYLQYEWDPDYNGSDGPHLIREYLSGGPPRDVVFDTTYVLQVFVFGDGSGNQVRVAMDERVGASWPNHEVTTWVTVDWEGWKMLEWDLSDPASVGDWIGDGVLNGNGYRIDSFQLNWNGETDAISGRIYFDDLRLIQRQPGVSIDPRVEPVIPAELVLKPPYPNPFNPSTTLRIELPKSGIVTLKVYDLQGRVVDELVDGTLPAGQHNITWRPRGIATGVYLIVLKQREMSSVQRVIYMK